MRADDEVLAFFPFEADESSILSEPLVATTLAYLKQNCVSTEETIAVSLSGGVDSMVISKILCVLKERGMISPQTTIIGIHIDYANREESGKEADYVESWCADRRINFEKRVVSEVTRGITDRNEYEKVSREIRYGFYQTTIDKYRQLTPDRPLRGIMFGHHIGDVQENVVSNIMR